jgi:hypothetical protein
LLTRLKGRRVFTGGTLKVHPEPNRPNHNTNNTGGHVLSNLYALLVGKLLSLGIVGLYFGPDHRAVRIRILRLHACHGRRITTGARRQREAKGHRHTNTFSHSKDPQ